MAGDLVRVDPVRGRRGLEALQHAHPVLAARLRRTLQVERQVDVDQPRGVLGALQVAAHPIEVIGDAKACLVLASRTQSAQPAICG